MPPPAYFGRLYLHFFDPHFLSLKGGLNRRLDGNLYVECRRATRFSVLASDEVLVPTASYFESPECFKILSELSDLFPLGILSLIGSGASVDEFAESKLSQYRPGSRQYEIYKSSYGDQLTPAFLSRKNSSTLDIGRSWLALGPEDYVTKSMQSARRLGYSLDAVERNWSRVPERLEQSAFIVPHIEPILFGDAAPQILLTRLTAVLNESYFLSYTQELGAGVVTNLIYLGAPHSIPSFDRDLPFKQLQLRAQRSGLLDEIDRADVAALLQLRSSAAWKRCLSDACTDHERLGLGSYMMQGRNSSATIGIVTALPVEYAAVCAVLGCKDLPPIPGFGAGRKYAWAHVPGLAGRLVEVVVCLMTTTGNNSAAIRATQLMSHFPGVRDFLMIGIAGGVPNHKKPTDNVRVGDVVISDARGVIQYDFDRETADAVEPNPHPRPPGAQLSEAVRGLQAGALLGKKPWKKELDNAIGHLGVAWARLPKDADPYAEDHPVDPERDAPDEPKVFVGPIASANKLLKNPAKRDALRDRYGVKAVEMEGSGIADATWNLQAQYLVIRGIVDYCDHTKGDAWHRYASLAAAAYCKALLKVL